jgi:hypothetical protein
MSVVRQAEHETTKYTPNYFIKDLLVISIDICIPEVKSNVALCTGNLSVSAMLAIVRLAHT